MQFPKWKKIDKLMRAAFPVAMTFLLVLLNLLPVSFGPASSVAPMTLVISVYYWSIFRPDLMPMWAIFLLGLFFDLASGVPVGLSIFVLLLLHYGISKQRRFFYHAPFLLIWGIFLLYAAGVFIVVWGLGSFLTANVIAYHKMLLQYGLTIVTYPIFAGLFAKVQQAFLKPDWA